MFACGSDEITTGGEGLEPPLPGPKPGVLPARRPPNGGRQSIRPLAEKNELELAALELALVLRQPLHPQRAAAVAYERLELLELGHRVEGRRAGVVGTDDFS